MSLLLPFSSIVFVPNSTSLNTPELTTDVRCHEETACYEIPSIWAWKTMLPSLRYTPCSRAAEPLVGSFHSRFKRVISTHRFDNHPILQTISSRVLGKPSPPPHPRMISKNQITSFTRPSRFLDQSAYIKRKTKSQAKRGERQGKIAKEQQLTAVPFRGYYTRKFL